MATHTWTRQAAAALTATATLAAVLAGVPAALIAAAGWPLPTQLPDLAALRQATQSGLSPDALVAVLAVIAWVAWLQIATAIVTETAALIRRRPAQQLPLLPGLQTTVAKLVATAAFLGAVGQQPATAAAGSLQLALAPEIVTTIQHQPNDPTPPTSASTTTVGTDTATQLTEYVTGPRDTWWQLAESHLGDGLRWRELRDLNVGHHVTTDLVLRNDHDQIERGWHLQLPAGFSAVGGDHTDLARAAVHQDSDADPETDTDASAPVSEWTVTEGEHFWSIAEQTLTDTLGRDPTLKETTGYWHELIDTNTDRLLPPHDPDLIYPGQRLAIPEPGATLPAADTEPSTSDIPGPRTSTSPLPTDDPAYDPFATESAAVREQAPPTLDEPQAEVEYSRLPERWTGAIDQRDAPTAAHGADTTADTDVSEHHTNGWGLPLDLRTGVAASILAAAGITALIRRRRCHSLQQRPAGMRLPTLAPEVDRTVRDLAAATPGDQVLEDLTTLLCSIPPDAPPALVTTTDDGEVTLLFDDDTTPPPPPDPWLPSDTSDDAGPAGWHAKLGDSGPIRSIGLPLLATLGRRHGRNVLANLAALGTLHIDGDPDQVRRRLRAVALEVATSRTAGPVEVLVLGDDPPADTDQLRRIHDPATEIAAARAEHDHDVVAEDHTIRLLVVHEPDTAPSIPGEIAANIGVVAAGRTEDGWLLELTGPNTGRLRLPDGGWIDLDLPDFEPAHVTQALEAKAPVDSESEREPAGEAAGVALVEPAYCEIQILGTPAVIRDGEPLDVLNGKALEAITYIATHRDGVTTEQLEDAVWNGRATATGSQRVRAALARARDLLGHGPDDQPLVPRRTKGQQQLRLSTHIGTDLDRAFAHLELARTLPDPLRPGELQAALDLIRGQPFAGWPLSWATDIQQRAIAQLQDAALELAQLCRTAGDHDTAIAAIETGLVLCDPAEPLYLEWARIEADRGRTDQVDRIWERLCRKYNDEAEWDAWVVAPSSPTELAFAELRAAPNR